MSLAKAFVKYWVVWERHSNGSAVAKKKKSQRCTQLIMYNDLSAGFCKMLSWSRVSLERKCSGKTKKIKKCQRFTELIMCNGLGAGFCEMLSCSRVPCHSNGRAEILKSQRTLNWLGLRTVKLKFAKFCVAMTVSTGNAASPRLTNSTNSDSLVSRGTNLNWDFSVIWICTKEFEFLDLVDFGVVAFSVESLTPPNAECCLIEPLLLSHRTTRLIERLLSCRVLSHRTTTELTMYNVLQTQQCVVSSNDYWVDYVQWLYSWILQIKKKLESAAALGVAVNDKTARQVSGRGGGGGGGEV